MKQEQYQKLKEVIQRANPEEDWDIAERTDEMWTRPIRLADVLASLPENILWVHEVADNKQALVDKNLPRLLALWDFFNDNLDNQSDETKQFLIDLLVKE